MRKVIYATSLSLDGFIEAATGPQDWLYPDEELHWHFNRLEDAIGTHLYGRRMYEIMASYWPTAGDTQALPAYELEYAQMWKQVEKVVFSRTLDSVGWNSRLVRDSAVAEVARLKRLPGKDMSVGGAALASALGAAGLIDEYYLYYLPIFIGSGTTVLASLRDRIQLVRPDVQTFASGAVLLKYQRKAQP